MQVVATVKVNEDGSVDLPPPLLERLGWIEGTKIELVDSVDGIVLRKPTRRQKTQTKRAI